MQPGNWTLRHFSHSNEQNELLIPATTWMTFWKLCCVKQANLKKIYCMTIYIVLISKFISIIQMEGRLMVAGVQGYDMIIKGQQEILVEIELWW